MSEGSGFRPHKWFVGFGAPACTHAQADTDTDTDTDRHLRYDPCICGWHTHYSTMLAAGVGADPFLAVWIAGCTGYVRNHFDFVAAFGLA